MASLEAASEVASPAEFVPNFAAKEYVDVCRTARIFGVGRSTVYRMIQKGYRDGRAAIELANYRRGARKLVLYSSIVAFCDFLRAEYAIEDRRPKLAHPGLRHRDEDLLPFPLSDTIYSAEALRALGYEDRRPLVNLMEEGLFDAYRLSAEYTWRISRSSFLRFLNKALHHEPDHTTAGRRSVMERLRGYGR